MKNAKIITILALVALCATSASAFDLPSTAAVEIVEGLTVVQVTGMDFGQVALHDGALVLSTNPATAMTDASFISFDETGYTPAVFTVSSIAGAAVTAVIADDGLTAGLTLGTFVLSLDGGTSDEADYAAVAMTADDETWNIGCTLTVVAASTAVGTYALGYDVGITMD